MTRNETKEKYVRNESIQITLEERTAEGRGNTTKRREDVVETVKNCLQYKKVFMNNANTNRTNKPNGMIKL